MSTIFAELKEYIGLGDADAHTLSTFAPAARPHVERFAEHFYAVLTAHGDARAVIKGGAPQIQRLKQTLAQWMLECVEGPYDEAYFQKRSRIGHVHVNIGLPQHYMFTAMNVIRLDFHELVFQVHGDDLAKARTTSDALDKIFDIELAIMLRTYQEDSEDRLRRRERLATIGQLAASIGHDLRNPLGVIQSSLYILSRSGKDPTKAARHHERIATQVKLCESIITNLLEMARNKPPRREPIQLEHLLATATEAVTLPPHLKIHISVEPGLELDADTALLRQAVVNLVTNAVDAHGSEPGTIELSAHQRGDWVSIEVADEGPGFSADAISRVFEPLVTTRPAGTGLGLALVKGVVERHGGSVEASNRIPRGAVVRMTLPPRDAAAKA